MSSRKDEFSGWRAPKEGSGVPGKAYDPVKPEPEGIPAGGEPVSHGTPMSQEDYDRLKDEAEHGRSPSDKNAQIDPSAC